MEDEDDAIWNERVWCVLKYSGDADGYRVTALQSDFLQTVQRRMRRMRRVRRMRRMMQERVMKITEKKIMSFDNN